MSRLHLAKGKGANADGLVMVGWREIILLYTQRLVCTCFYHAHKWTWGFLLYLGLGKMPCGNTGYRIGMLGPEVGSPARWFLMSLLLLLGDFSLVVTVYTLWVMVEELETNRVFFWKWLQSIFPLLSTYTIFCTHTHTYTHFLPFGSATQNIHLWVDSIPTASGDILHFQLIDTLILVLCLISFCNLQFNQSLESILYFCWSLPLPLAFPGLSKNRQAICGKAKWQLGSLTRRWLLATLQGVSPWHSGASGCPGWGPSTETSLLILLLPLGRLGTVDRDNHP